MLLNAFLESRIVLCTHRKLNRLKTQVAELDMPKIESRDSSLLGGWLYANVPGQYKVPSYHTPRFGLHEPLEMERLLLHARHG